MESMGAISEREWSSLSGMYTAEEADFMAQLLNNCSAPNDLNNGGPGLGFPLSYWPGHESNYISGIEEGSYYSTESSKSDLYRFSQGSSRCYSGVSANSGSNKSCFLSDSQPILVSSNSSLSMEFGMEEMRNRNSYQAEGDDCLNQEMSESNVEESANIAEPGKDSQPKRVSDMTTAMEDKDNPTKKRPRNSGDIPKAKRNVRSKKNQKAASTCQNEEDGSNAGLNGQSTSSCCSEDESNASQEEPNEGATPISSPKGSAKTRATRGSATDPLSLYARKRRERIIERLRILQNLVPNGTKVDISTMLEEAVQYVKFLQLQIKLLSSDDLWMYAPIPYNGLNIGLDLKLTPPKQS